MKPPTDLPHMLWIVRFSAVSGFFTKTVWFKVAFICSLWLLLKICILFSFNTIVLAFEECNFTAPQFILAELMEQLSGNVMFAFEVKFQLTDITSFLTGEFSVIIISPSKKSNSARRGNYPMVKMNW